MLQLIDDETASRYYNEIDTATGDDLQTKMSALESWATDKKAKQHRQEWDQVSGVFTDFDNYSASEGLNDLDEESRYQYANRQFIAHQTGGKFEDQMFVYPSKRDEVTDQMFGKTGVSEKEAFNLFKGAVESRKASEEALRELPGVLAQGVLKSAGEGKQFDEVDSWFAFDGWKQRHADKLGAMPAGWETAMLDSAVKLHARTEALMADVAPESKRAMDVLMKFTRPEDAESLPDADRSDVENLAKDFAKLTPEQRDGIYATLSYAAEADGAGLGKGFWEKVGEGVARGGVNIYDDAAMTAEDRQARQNISFFQDLLDKPQAEPDRMQTAESIQMQRDMAQDGLDKNKERLGELRVMREIRDLAQGRIDPIKTEMDGVLGSVVQGAYDFSQSAAYTGMAMIPYVGLPAVMGALANSNYLRMLDEYPDMDADAAYNLSLAIAGPQAVIERFQGGLLLGKLPYLNQAMKRLTDVRVPLPARLGLGYAGVVGAETVTELAQEAMPVVADQIASAVREDMPEFDSEKAWGEYREQAPKIFYSMLWGGLIGGGAVGIRELDRSGVFMRNVQELEMHGITGDAAQNIAAEQDADKATTLFREAWDKRSPEDIQAGISKRAAMLDAAQATQANPDLPTRRVEQAPDGTTTHIIEQNGQAVYRTSDPAAADMALINITRMMDRSRITGTTTGIVESMQFIDQVKQATNRGEDVQKLLLDGAPRTLFDDYEANPTEQNLDNLFSTVREFGYDISEPAELANFPVLASNQGELAEGIFKSVIRIQDGATGVEVMRDFSQDNLKRAIGEGRVTMDWVREQLNQVIPLIESDRIEGRKLGTETDTGVIESFSDVAVAYMTGRIRDEQVPAGFRGFLRRMAIVVKDIFRRAYRLKRAIADGKVDSNFESFLADSVGLNQQARVDTASSRVSKDIITDGGQMLMDFSIGSRTSAVSTDTPSIRASNATITGPANYSIGAFHGTPHKVDKFTTEKIGTGEGAQAYGWGLYFAGNKKVAEQYRKGLTEKDFIRKVRDVFSEFDGVNEQEGALTELPLSDGQRKLLDVLKREDWWGFDYPHQAVQAALREPENFDTSPDLYEALKTFGNFYTVDLDVEPEDLLDWDKPLSEQSPKVKAALQSVSDNWLWQDAISGKSGEQVGGALYSTLRATFPDAEFSRDGVDASKKASEALLAAGIPGIRYLDGGSRSEGQGTYNYVAFDENLIRITEENGNRIAATDALAAPATGATNYSISVQTTAANILADRLKIPTNLGKEYAGRQIIPIEADLTAGGGSFTQKPAQGGPAFSVIPEYFNAGVAWAAAKDGFWTGKLNLARESGAIYIGKDGKEKFLVAPYAMKQDSHISNPTVAGEKFSEVSRYIRENRISKTQEQGISDLIQKSAVKGIATATSDLKTAKAAVAKAESDFKKAEALVKKSEKSVNKDKTEETEKALKSALKDFKSAESNLKAKKDSASEALAKKTFFEGIGRFPSSLTSKSFDTYLASLSFDQRKFLGEKLSSAEAEKLGAPPMDQIRRATLDESFAGVESLSLVSILEIDVKRLEEGLKNKTLTASAYGVTPHNSYNSLAPGKPVAFFRTPIPYSLALPDIRAGLFGAGFKSNHGYFLKGKIPVGLPKLQKISSQMLSDWGDAQTSLRPNQAKAIVTALNQGWKTYTKPRQAGLAEFTRALRNNDAAVTLTQYSSEEVSQLLKEGKIKIFQLGDMNVWFALKRPGEGEAGDPKKDWHIVSVANNEKGSPGMLPLIMSKALAEGGTYLDCYAVKSSKYPDGLLPTLYAKSGFEVTEVLPFDPQYHTEPGKMGELEKVWDSQKWNGQEKPPLVYMKWNPELHANIGTNADAGRAISIASKDAGGMAERKAKRAGRVAEDQIGDMGGAGQGVQGRGVSDGASPTGNTGNARNILPRGIEQIVADLGKLNDYQLQALGLTKSEVDDAIGIYNDHNSVSYSIASQSDIDRVNRALGGMNRGPDERLKVYERAREKFSLLQAWNRDELQAMQETGADDTTIRRSQILQGLGELDAILSILPPEVRGRVGGYTKLASIAPHDVFKDGVKVSEVSGMNGAIISAWMREGQNIGQAGKQVSLPPGYEAKENLATKRADKAIADFFRDRIKKIDAEFEKVVAREYRNAILDLVKKSRPKAGDNNVRKSTLGAETQKLADMVQRATLMDEDATAERMLQLEQTMATSENSADMVEEWGILNQFGDLKNRNSETLAQAYGWFKDQLQMGREAWRIKEEARIAENRERAKKTVEHIGGATAVDRFKDKTFMDRVSDWANSALLDHASFEQFVTALLPPDVAADFSTRLRKADIAAQKAEIDQREGILNALREGAKAAGTTTGKAMEMLKTEVPSAVRYLDGRKVKNNKLTIEQAEKIVRGEIDRSDLTDTDVRNLSDELAALPADTRKENITLKQVVYPGKEVRLPMTRGKAIQLLLSWNQPDVQDKMRREGWNEDSIADLRELTSDPVSQAMIAHAQELYGKGAGVVNPVYARMFGMNMPQVKNYAPTRFLHSNDVKDIGLDGSPVATGTTPGFAKSRVTHSAKIAPEDALSVMQQHILTQAHWVNFAELAREYRSLINNPEIREAIKAKHGTGVLKTAELWADQMEQRGGNQSREAAWVNAILGSVIGGQSVASLGFNLKTLAMQLDNSVRFALALDKKQIMAAMSSPDQLIEDIKTVFESDALQTRLRGGATAETRYMFERFGGKPGTAAKVTEAAMSTINWMDTATTSFSAAIVYRANLNEALEAGMPESLARETALDAAAAAIYRFAQPVSFGQKSNVENSGNIYTKAFFLFMSDPRLKTAIMADAVRGLATGRGDKGTHIRRLVAAELMAVLSHVVASAYRDAFTDDEDEDIWGLGGFVRALALAPLQGFFFAGTMFDSVLSQLTGAGFFTPTQNPLLTVSQTGIRALKNADDILAFDDPDALLKEWSAIARTMAVAPAAAMPAVLLNIVKPIFGAASNATSNE